MNKLVRNIREALELCHIEDGLRISFHHGLRNGDYVLNMVMQEIAGLGIRNLTLNASSLFSAHEPLIRHIEDGVVTKVETDYVTGKVADAISAGIVPQPVTFLSHGGRADRMKEAEHRIDIAFIAASASDPMGNCSGKYGASAFGSMGYALCDARYAKKVVVITDDLRPYPLYDFSIPETDVDYVVCVESIGDPALISTGTTKLTRDPIQHSMARTAANVIAASALLKDGFNFQTGSGGGTLATALYLGEIMKERSIHGGCCVGGMTGHLVRMLDEGTFDCLLDVQCFDLEAVASLKSNPRHREISAEHYAGFVAKSSAVNCLDAVLLGATQIDTEFNVNVHTSSTGRIIGGSGGHCDAAAGAKLTIILAPLIRHRIPIVVEHVLCKSTPGSTVDALVTQYGVAVNPQREELGQQLRASGIKVVDIHDLQKEAERISGVPARPRLGSNVVADVIYRDGSHMDSIYSVKEPQR